MRLLETDSFTNKDISSAVSIGSYTATAVCGVTVRVLVAQAAGNGDYVIYCTLTKSTVEYRVIPITTANAASGVTSLGFVSIVIPMDVDDLLQVYIDGLAGDNSTPDTRVDFYVYNYLQPTVAGRTLDVAATGEAGLDFTNRLDTTGILPNAAAGAASGLAIVGSAMTLAANQDVRNVGGNVAGSVGSVTGNVTVGGYAAGQAPLQPATGGRALLVDAAGRVEISGTKNTLDALPVPLTAQQARNALALPLSVEIPVGEGSIDFSRVSADMTLTAIDGVTTKLNTMLEADGEVSRFTTNALEAAPGGGANITVHASVALTAAQANAVMTGTLALITFHTFDQTINSNTQNDLTDGELLFALKQTDRDKDTHALILLSSLRGLLTVDGAEYSTDNHGSIIVTGEAGAWHVLLHLDAAVIGLLTQYAGARLQAEVKHLDRNKTPIWTGTATLERGVIQEV